MRYYGTVFAKIFVEDGGKLVLDSVKEDIDQPFAGRIEVSAKKKGARTARFTLSRTR